MAKKTPDTAKELEKKAQKAGTLFDQFTQAIQEKKLAIQQSAREAKDALRSIRSSERQSAVELTKIKSAASKAIDSAKNDALSVTTKVKKEVSDAYDEVDGIRDDTRKSYGRFKRSYDAALNGERGIVARKNDIAARHEKIKVAHSEIDNLNKSALEQAGEIKTAHTDSLADRELVGQVKSRAEEIRTEIEKTYHITIDSAMGGALNVRKNEIQTALVGWTIGLVVSVLLLVGAIGLLIYLSVTSTESVNLLEAVTNRLVYLTPLLFVIFMTYRQYSHERRLVEEYAFKAAMAQTLRNYAVLLSDNYKHVPQAEEKIVKFLLDSMGSIYDRSSLDNTSGFFYQLIVGSKQLGAQATIQEGVSEMKETTKLETKKEKKVS